MLQNARVTDFTVSELLRILKALDDFKNKQQKRIK